jgi:beta-glucanase (GH16 family)
VLELRIHPANHRIEDSPMRQVVTLSVGFCATFAIAFALMPGSASAAPHKHNPPAACAAWRDDFNTARLDPRWMVGNGGAPGYIPGEHLGLYRPEQVTLGNGLLTMRLTQAQGLVDGVFGVVSSGALLSTRDKCGYGIYEWKMRMSSTASSPANPGAAISGSVSAGFIYVNNSQTEIDFEFPANDPTAVYAVNWLNPRPSRDPRDADGTSSAIQPFDASGGFHTYRFVWQPGVISFFIDGRLRAKHTTDVPSAPASFMINHWGTDSVHWGGAATLGVDRFFYIDSVSYTPLP